jgi:hypothetical protein
MRSLLASGFAMLLAAGGGALAQGITDWGYEWGRWRVDFDGNKTPDYCRAVGPEGSYEIWCTLSPSEKVEDLYAGETVKSGVLDVGYPEGRSWVDFDADGKVDYCRVVGTGYPNSYVRCTFSDGRTFGPTINSESLDWGFPDSRKWADVNDDKMPDFCREIGNNREFYSCTLSAGRKGFGRTIRDVK